MIIYHDQIDSTNRVAKELAKEGKPAGTVVQAGQQSAGRGQYGRVFSSPPGGLYFSLILQPDLELEHLPLVTLATGLSCREVLQASFGLDTRIKWPNDIYLDHKKIAGMLCESVLVDSPEIGSSTVVVGVGLNVNSAVSDFPSELQPIVTTLFAHLNTKIQLPSLLILLVETISANVEMLSRDPQAILAQWQRYDYLQGQEVVHTAGSTTIVGTGRGLSAHGYYRILDLQGVEHRVPGGQLRLQTADAVSGKSSPVLAP